MDQSPLAGVVGDPPATPEETRKTAAYTRWNTHERRLGLAEEEIAGLRAALLTRSLFTLSAADLERLADYVERFATRTAVQAYILLFVARRAVAQQRAAYQ